MNLIVRPGAAADIEDAHSWYLDRDRDLASSFLDELRSAFDRVRRNPKAYPVLYRDTRRVRLKRFPYGLYYRIYPHTIVIVACMHGRRNPIRWRSRE